MKFNKNDIIKKYCKKNGFDYRDFKDLSLDDFSIITEDYEDIIKAFIKNDISVNIIDGDNWCLGLVHYMWNSNRLVISQGSNGVISGFDVVTINFSEEDCHLLSMASIEQVVILIKLQEKLDNPHRR